MGGVTVSACVAETPSIVAVTTTFPRVGVYKSPVCVIPAFELAQLAV